MVMKAGIWGEEKDFCNKLVSSDWFLNSVPGLVLKKEAKQKKTSVIEA